MGFGQQLRGGNEAYLFISEINASVKYFFKKGANCLQCRKRRGEVLLREGRYGSTPFQCDDETSQGVQRLLPDGHLVSIDTARCGLGINKVS